MTGTFNVRLKEYYWNGSEYSPVSGAWPAWNNDKDLEFTPNPNEVSKAIEPPWRTSALGLATPSGRRRLGKSKWRKKFKTEFTFAGECNGAMRRKIEWFASRWSKFLIYEDDAGQWNDPKRFLMDTPEPDRPQPDYTDVSNEPIYVVFTSVDFTQTSKLDWYRYTIKLFRTDKRDIDAAEPGTYY